MGRRIRTPINRLSVEDLRWELKTWEAIDSPTAVRRIQSLRGWLAKRERQQERQRGRVTSPPKTTMVYCPPCMKHWEAPAHEDYWTARTELCPRHKKMADEGITEEDIEETRYPTSFQDSER